MKFICLWPCPLWGWTVLARVSRWFFANSRSIHPLSFVSPIPNLPAVPAQCLCVPGPILAFQSPWTSIILLGSLCYTQRTKVSPSSTALRHGGKQSWKLKMISLPQRTGNHFSILWCVPSLSQLADIVLAGTSTETGWKLLAVNHWKWWERTGDQELYDAANDLSHSIFRHTFSIGFNLGSVVARKKGGMLFLRFQFSVSVDP